MAGMFQAYSTPRNKAIGQRQLSHYWYYGGMDHFNPSKDYTNWEDYYADGDWLQEASDYFTSIGRPNAISPWWGTQDRNVMDSFGAIKEDNYNPFIGNEGAWVTPEGNDLRGSNNGTADGYRDDSISAYLKNAFAGQDQVQNRANALRAFKKWNGTGRGINTATTRMSRQHFNDLGLGEFGLEYEEPESGASKMLNGTAEGGPSKAAQMLQGGGGTGGRAGEMLRGGVMSGGSDGEMLRGGLMSGGGDAMRDVIYGKAQERIFGE